MNALFYTQLNVFIFNPLGKFHYFLYHFLIDMNAKLLLPESQHNTTDGYIIPRVANDSTERRASSAAVSGRDYKRLVVLLKPRSGSIL